MCRCQYISEALSTEYRAFSYTKHLNLTFWRLPSSEEQLKIHQSIFLLYFAKCIDSEFLQKVFTRNI